MLVQTGIYLEDDVVAEIDAKIGRGSRSEWIRGAMRLRLMVEGTANAHDHPAGQWAREILALAQRGEVTEEAAP
jgi:metal-responsive CopG/Arc/MetJ family transcriptional regulator